MYTTQEIANIIGAKSTESSSRQIDWLLTDSRSLCFPESTLFFALRTSRGDGHRYIEELYRRGVRAFVVNETSCPQKGMEDADFLAVPDTLQALQTLAAHHRSRFRIPVIGITGSNGKTLVKEWLYQLLAPDFTVTGCAAGNVAVAAIRNVPSSTTIAPAVYAPLSVTVPSPSFVKPYAPLIGIGSS